MYTCTMMQSHGNSPAPRRARVRRPLKSKAAAPSSSAETCCPELADLLDPRLFRALADGNRLALLMRLAACGRPCSVGELNACCPVDLSVVSRHLATLRDAGALEAQKRGKEVFYRVRFERLVPLLRGIAGALENCRCSAEACCSAAIDQAAKPASRRGRPRTSRHKSR